MSMHKFILQLLCNTYVLYNPRLIITGDVMGHILFFDKRIKLLYWCVDFQLGSIISISFNLQVNTYSVEDFEIDEGLSR